MADDLSKRLAGLSPEQRELLLRRLKKKGLDAVVPPTGAAPQPAPSSPGLPEPAGPHRPIRFSLPPMRRSNKRAASASPSNS